jgi:hypothetical protein
MDDHFSYLKECVPRSLPKVYQRPAAFAGGLAAMLERVQSLLPPGIPVSVRMIPAHCLTPEEFIASGPPMADDDVFDAEFLPES